MIFKKFNIVYHGIMFNELDYAQYKENHFEEYKNLNKVIILMDRTQDLLFTIMMCLEMDITYIPIDTDYPIERIEYIINNVKPDKIVYDEDAYNVFIRLNIPRVESKEEREIAHILYTSGTTGMPKGVKITKKSLINFIDGISEIIKFSERDRIVCLTTVSFDIFFLESIMALYKGLTVILADKEEQNNPRRISKILIDNSVSMLQMTPSRMQMLINYDKEMKCLKNVKTIMIGGEVFPEKLLKLLQKYTDASIYNMYGPTETTIWSSVSDLTGKEMPDIGKAIKNTQFYITNELLEIVEEGQAGEICIGGDGLSKGYVDPEHLTKERFTYLKGMDTFIYRTGDMGKIAPDGNLIYLGRLDNQIKYHGFRIEPEEIEYYINSYPQIMQSIVKLDNTGETPVLKCFYTSEQEEIDNDKISKYLRQKLPEYMIPGIYIKVQAFMYTQNGKIDRNKIYEVYKSMNQLNRNCTQDAVVYIQNNDIKSEMMELIKTSLDKNIADATTYSSGLNEIGVDSVTFINMVVMLEEKYSFEFDDNMLKLTAFPTIQSLIDYVYKKFS